MTTPTSIEIFQRAWYLATEAANNAGGLNEDGRYKARELTTELVKRLTDSVELGLEPMNDSLEELMPGFNFAKWHPLSLAIRRRAQKLVNDNILFPDGIGYSPDIVTEMRAEAMEVELVKRMTDLASLDIDPLSMTWEELLPA